MSENADMLDDMFDGAIALITGASRGIGKALAIELGARGVKVGCAARATNENPLKLPGTVDETVEIIEQAGGQALAIPTDLSSPEEIESMVKTCAEHFGGLDILVNNAAVTFNGDMGVSPKHYDLMMNINVKAPLLTMLHSKPHLEESKNARIINVSSVTSLMYIPSMMTYGMSKAALDHLSVSAAAQLEGIAVNCFRIDVQVASEGYMMNAPDEDFSKWFSAKAAALGMCWMLEQPQEYTGKIEDMLELGTRTGIMGDVKNRNRLETRWVINPGT